MPNQVSPTYPNQPSQDFYNQLVPGLTNWQKLGGSDLINRQAGTTFGNIGQFGQQALPLGFSNLLGILASQGQTDPRLMNQELSGIDRSTQANQMNLMETLAQSGLQGSNLGIGLGAAIGQGGAQLKAQRMAQESQMQEARKRQDLDLLLRLIIDPSMQGFGIQRNYQAQKSAGGSDPLGTIAGVAGATAPYWAPLLFCWVAREVYGAHDPRWLAVRSFVLRTPGLREDYLRFGPRAARLARRHPWIKAAFKRAMDRVV